MMMSSRNPLPQYLELKPAPNLEDAASNVSLSSVDCLCFSINFLKKKKKISAPESCEKMKFNKYNGSKL